MPIVMKVGGALDGLGERELGEALAVAHHSGCEIVLVHGGGPEISRRLAAEGVELPFVDGLRQTTDEAIPIVVDALQFCHRQILHSLRDYGLPMESFLDRDVVRARDVGKNRTGDVAEIFYERLEEAFDAGHIPLLPPYGSDAAGRMYNLNADVVATHLAVACRADKLIFCTNVAGVFIDFEQGMQLYDVTAEALASIVASGALSAGMLPKVTAMLSAHDRGVNQVWVVDGRDGESLQHAVSSASEYDPERQCYGTRLIRQEMMMEVQS